MKHLLPLLFALTACGPAFEADLFPDAGDAGSAVETGRPGSYVDAGLSQDGDGGSPESQVLEAASDAQEAASDAQDALEAAAEAEASPQCSAPRCVDGVTVQNCDDGAWGAFTTCPFVCEGNNCSGVCVPGATSCSSSTQLQTCSASGTWMASTCPDACVGSTCGGVCVPGTTEICFDACSDQGSKTCGSNGQWGSCSVSCGG